MLKGLNLSYFTKLWVGTWVRDVGCVCEGCKGVYAYMGGIGGGGRGTTPLYDICYIKGIKENSSLVHEIIDPPT